MNPKLLIGVLLLAGGAILLYMGYQETQTLGSRMSGALGSDMSNQTLMMLGGGGVAAVLGLLMIVRTGRR